MSQVAVTVREKVTFYVSSSSDSSWQNYIMCQVAVTVRDKITLNVMWQWQFVTKLHCMCQVAVTVHDKITLYVSITSDISWQNTNPSLALIYVKQLTQFEKWHTSCTLAFFRTYCSWNLQLISSPIFRIYQCCTRRRTHALITIVQHNKLIYRLSSIKTFFLISERSVAQD